MNVSFWDIKSGDLIKAAGQAQNIYEITTKSEKQVCMRSVKKGVEHCMATDQFMDLLHTERLLLDTKTNQDLAN
ncbi:MAG: hypothetical protein V1913_07340 [Fibrobacterota bacterium]